MAMNNKDRSSKSMCYIYYMDSADETMGKTYLDVMIDFAESLGYQKEDILIYHDTMAGNDPKDPSADAAEDFNLLRDSIKLHESGVLILKNVYQLPLDLEGSMRFVDETIRRGFRVFVGGESGFIQLKELVDLDTYTAFFKNYIENMKK